MDHRREFDGELATAAPAAASSLGPAALTSGGPSTGAGRLLRRLRSAVPAEHAGVERDSGKCGRDDDRNDDDFFHR
jgi:hypothetical protein